MAYEKYNGVINSISGERVVNNNANVWKFSILEIEGKVLQNILAPNKLVLFLNAGEKVGIYVDDNNIIALERADGKLFVVNHRKPGVISLVFGIAMLPLYGVGLLLLFLRHKGTRKYRYVQEIIAQHPSYENLQG